MKVAVGQNTHLPKVIIATACMCGYASAGPPLLQPRLWICQNTTVFDYLR